MSTRKKLTILVASIAGFLVLIPVAFHFYLRWDCARYRAELDRKGEKLKIQEVAPRPPLPAENGAPALRGALAQLATASRTNLYSYVPRAMTGLTPGHALINWQQAELWRGSGDTNTWTEFREEVDRYAQILEEFRVALENRAFDFNLNYAQGFNLALPHLARLKSASQMLKGSALLHLHEKKLEAALRDLNSLIALVRVPETEPLMISQLVHITLMSIAVAATWEALQANGWTDSQLAELQRRWAEQEVMQPFLASLMMERAMALQEIDKCRDSFSYYRKQLGVLVNAGYTESSDKPLHILVEQIQKWTWPVLGSYRTERTCLTVDQAGITALRDTATNTAYTSARKNINAALTKLGFRTDGRVSGENDSVGEPSSIDAAFTQGALSLLFTIKRPFTAEAQARIVTTVIALKRYELRHGKLPQNLSALVPDFLPTAPLDPMNGQLLQFRPNTNSTFLLYSVGADGEDNGGDPTPSGTGPRIDWLSGRDWVWPQPATPEEVNEYNRRMRDAVAKESEKRQPGRRKGRDP